MPTLQVLIKKLKTEFWGHVHVSIFQGGNNAESYNVHAPKLICTFALRAAVVVGPASSTRVVYSTTRSASPICVSATSFLTFNWNPEFSFQLNSRVEFSVLVICRKGHTSSLQELYTFRTFSAQGLAEWVPSHSSPIPNREVKPASVDDSPLGKSR